MPPLDPNLETYLRERDAVLLDPDLDRLRAHFVKWGKPEAMKASDEVMRMAWHKARAATTSLPMTERRQSARWLEARGFTHHGDDILDDSN